MKPAIIASFAALLIFTAQPAQAIHITWKNHHHVASLSQDLGHYVLVHFWASWCLPCREELPELAAWSKAHPNIIFVPISLDRSEYDAEHFLHADHLLGVPLLMGNVNDAARIGIRAIPTTLIVDPKGNVIRTLHGAQPWGTDTFSQSVLDSLSGHNRY